VIATKNLKPVGHSSVICWLCEEAQVEEYRVDLDAPTMKPITDKVMEGFVKKFDEFIREIP